MKKSLIEEPTVELLELFDKVSEEARVEKNAIPPINKMAYWWTRKPLIVGRAVALTSTLDNIEDVRNLLGLRKDSRAYKHLPDVGVYKKKLGRDPSEIKVLDPFAGAGNLIFEAKRLGLDCTSSDYNPVAYLIEKTVLDYPAKYGTKLADDFEKYSKQVLVMTQNEIGKFYKENDLVYFWVWCIKCPHCNQRIPLVNHMWIANTPKTKLGVRYHVTPDKNFKTELIQNMTVEEGKKFTQKGGKAICISCKNTIDSETMANNITTRKDNEMIVIQVKVNGNRKYVLATESDKKTFEDASKFLKSKYDEYVKSDLIPVEGILAADGKKHRVWRYGIKNWYEFFNPRQLLVNVIILKNIKLVCKEIQNKEYAKVISVYLGALLTKLVDSNCFGVHWNTAGQKVEGAIAFRQPRIVYNYNEINPLNKIRGSLQNLANNFSKGIIFASNNSLQTKIKYNSVLKYSTLQKKYDIIITDPPYGDDVQYGEISEFFYVWLYRSVKEYFPELPSRVPKEEDFCVSVGRFNDKKLASEFFEKGLKKSFVSMNKKLKDDGLLVVFFAHSSIEAWNMLLNSIRAAEFQVISSYSIHTESTTNVLAQNKTSFMSSIIVTCRKLTEQKTAYFEDIIPQTEDNIKEMIDKIPAEKILTIPITDLLIMVYGKVLETCTQFTELKSYEKDFKPDFETLIKDSQDFIMRQLVTKLTGRNMNLIGPEMAFYLLVRIFYRGKMAADDAIKITRAITVDLNKLEKEVMITNVGGVTNLTPLQETNMELKPEELDNANLYQQLCYLATICQTKGASKVSAILSQSSGNIKADELKKIVPLLIKSYRNQINKNQTLDDSEKEELKLLETIQDTWGGTKIEGSLDGFIEKK